MTERIGGTLVPETVRSRWRRRTSSLKRQTVGDDVGLIVFLVSLVVLIGLWRVGFFITDNVTIANTLANVAEGRLAVTESPYSMTAGSQPGLVTVDGVLYGRNYGQVYLAVPVVWGLDLITGLVDLRLLLAAAWSFAVIWLGRTVARLVNVPAVRRIATVAGLVAFAASISLATDVDALTTTNGLGPVSPIIALQIVTMLITAIAATALYRLVRWAQERRVAFMSGLAAVLATPLGFWGTIPKRHTYVAAAILVVCFWFGVSREASGRKGLLLRAGAYGMIGLLASIHPFEAAFLLAVLFIFDIATAGRNSRRAIAVVVGILLISLVPFALTNLGTTGNLLEPTNIQPDAEDGDLPVAGEPPSADPGGDAGSGGDQPPPDNGNGKSQPGTPAPDGSDGDSGGASAIAWLVSTLSGIYASLFWIGTAMTGYIEAGISEVPDLGSLYSIFVRSGWIPGIQHHINDFETIEMALLETLPITGGILGIPVLVGQRIRSSRPAVEDVRAALGSPIRQTDALVLAIAVTFVVVYLPLMPNNSLITLRYIVPIMPLVVYGLGRLEPVQQAAHSVPRSLSGSYLVAVGIATVGAIAVVSILDLAVGEAIQFHALIGLASAIALAGAIGSWPLHGRPKIVAVTLAVAAGVTTSFITLSSLVYFRYDAHALDIVRIVAEGLPALG